MAIVHTPPKATRERLNWIARYSPRAEAKVRGPRYLIAPALLAVVLLIVVLAIAVGAAATEMFQVYTHWLQSLATAGSSV